MQVQPITNNSFFGKNTFLQKSINAGLSTERGYYKSLHHEAKSRMYNIKFHKTLQEFDDFEHSGSINDTVCAIGMLGRMMYQKLRSGLCEENAHIAFPNRFAEADDKNIFPHRYYMLKIKEKCAKVKYV